LGQLYKDNTPIKYMGLVNIVNIEVLDELVLNKDIKFLFNDKKIYFSYLNQEHCDIEKSAFGLDGKLERTSPGYVKPWNKIIEIRKSKFIDSEKVAGIMQDLMSNEGLKILQGYKIMYAGKYMGVFDGN